MSPELSTEMEEEASEIDSQSDKVEIIYQMQYYHIHGISKEKARYAIAYTHIKQMAINQQPI